MRRVHQIIVENFAFFVVLDGLTYFLVRYFQHVLCIIDSERASLHENQVAVLSFLLLLLCLKQFPVPLPSSPLCRCSFIGMVFQGKCAALSDVLSWPTFIRQWLLIVCICVPSFHLLCDTLFAALIDHAWDLGIGFSLLRIQESTMIQICLCSTVDLFPMAASIFRMCSIRYQFPNFRRNLDIVSSKKSRRTRRFRCCPFQWSTPLILDWSGWSRISCSPSAICSCLGDFRTAQLIVELFLFDLLQLVQQRNVECQGSENQHNGHCHRSPCADELHSHDRRIFSILKQVHPSKRVASSAHVLLEVTWETCMFCTKVLPLFSCKPLYRYKSLIVCLKE